MMDDGVSRILEFLRAEAKRGHLCNLAKASGASDPPDLC